MKKLFYFLTICSFLSCDENVETKTEYIEVNKDINIFINYSYSTSSNLVFLNPNRHSIGFLGYNETNSFNLKINEHSPNFLNSGYNSKTFYFDIPIFTKKNASISIGVENKLAETQIILPDTVIIYEPYFNEIKSPGKEFTLRWNSSKNAKYFFITLNVSFSGGLLDTSFFATNNEVLIPGKYVMENSTTRIYVTAINGPAFNASDPYERKNGLSYRCYSKVLTAVFIKGSNGSPMKMKNDEIYFVDPEEIFKYQSSFIN